MTLQQLNQHAELREKLRKAEALVYRLESKAHPGAQVLTGMPHAPGVRDLVGDLAVEIAEAKEAVDDLEARIKAEEPEVKMFISSIDDVTVRTIFRLKFIRGLAWKEIPEYIDEYATKSSVSSAVYSYMRKHDNTAYDI